MIRVRGIPIPDEDARELIARLSKDHAAAELVARMRRMLDSGRGLVATDHVETRSLLVAVDELLDRGPSERLLELRASLAATIAG